MTSYTRFLRLLAVIAAVVFWLFGTAALMASGMWWFGAPLFILGLALQFWIWEQDYPLRKYPL